MSPYGRWIELLNCACHALAPVADEEPTLTIAPPASPELVEAAEAEMGRRFPDELRRLFLECSSQLDFHWCIDEERIVLPESLQTVTFGGCDLDLAIFPTYYFNWTGWAECLARPDLYGPSRFEYESLFPAFSIVNGDVVALITAGHDQGGLVYLDHESGEFNETLLAPSFEAFMDVWLSLGCPGPEGWLLSAFYDSQERRISADGNIARQWKQIVGLK